MTRHIITKTLLAAGALTVLAAAPSAMAAPEKPIKQKTKKSQNFTKVASNKTRSHRSDRNRNYRSRTRSNRNRNYNRSYNTALRRISSLSHGNRSYYSPYRSNIGISFNIGSPGYSPYRWSQSAYSLYRPTYGSYGSYRTRTTCRRVTLEAWRHGRPSLVSVKQCSNPWNGSYIVQGSERHLNYGW